MKISLLENRGPLYAVLLFSLAFAPMSNGADEIPANRLRSPVKAKQSWLTKQATDNGSVVDQVKAIVDDKSEPKTENANAVRQASHSAPITGSGAHSSVRSRNQAVTRIPAAATRSRQMQRSPQNRRGAPARREPSKLLALTSDIIGGEPMYESHYGAGYCEPGCGCDSCCGEPMCGIEPGCGFESYCGEPMCGIEPGCGCGPMCGVDACCDGCGYGCGGHCGPCFPWNPFGWWDWRRTQLFVGVQGFTGPPNYGGSNTPTAREGSGSFGFHQGFNYGRPLYWFGRGYYGWQFGLRTTQSNLDGASFTDESRSQLFLTGGIFRRVDCGFHWGLVVDYLSDEWYYHADLVQLRGELGWNLTPNNEFGFRMTASTQSTSSVNGLLSTNDAFQATDQYRLYHRRILHNGIEVDANAGVTENGDVLLGSNFDIPLTGRLNLRTGVDYLIPEGAGAVGEQEESWNLGFSLVWFPCGRPCGGRDYYRPLFNVADNGSFMVDRN